MMCAPESRDLGLCFDPEQTAPQQARFPQSDVSERSVKGLLNLGFKICHMNTALEIYGSRIQERVYK